VLAVILKPLARQNASPPADDRAFDQAVYRHQLTELEREKEEGLVPASEAEAARNEIALRLLRADAETSPPGARASSLRRAVFVVSLLSIPLLTMGVYLVQGSPGLPGTPRAERLANAEVNRDMEALVAKVEAHLAGHPADAEGWRVLAPAYRSLGHFDAATRAYAKALEYGKPDADLFADFGEVLVMQAQGVITEKAAGAFDAAMKLDGRHPKARYFLSLALMQDGKPKEALAGWQAMLMDAPADAPWRSVVESQIAAARFQAIAPQLDRNAVDAAETLTPDQRAAMIRSMVDGLAAKLAANGADLEGWLKLARARMVLGEPDKAKDALDRAGEIFKSDEQARARIEEMRRNLAQQ
jgi:cytochrome c-type biogenesis protein CcmH